MGAIQPGILGIGSYVPERILTNEELAKRVETSDEWIRTRTGIRERRIAADHEACSDLAAKAARVALTRAQLAPEEIDLIIVATFTPDMIFPATACLVQHQLGCERAGAFDLSAACTGFVYALAVADGFIRSGAYQNILVIGSEVISRVINWQDRGTCVLFGDGAAAVVVGPVRAGRGLLAHYLRADGGGADCLKIPASGSRLPATHAVIDQGLQYLAMNGKEVFKFAARVVGETVDQVLAKAGLTIGEVDLVIPHQANSRIIQAAADRLAIPREKVFENLDRYGNTSAASIPLALDEAVTLGKVKEDSLIVFSGFGAGLTYGATALRWGR